MRPDQTKTIAGNLRGSAKNIERPPTIVQPRADTKAHRLKLKVLILLGRRADYGDFLIERLSQVRSWL